MKIIDERETQKKISVEVMKIIDERETQKNKYRKEQGRTEATVKR